LYPEFAQIVAGVAARLPSVSVVGNRSPPRMGSFEVLADDGTVLFSKRQSGGPPQPQRVVDDIVRHMQPGAATRSHDASRSPASPFSASSQWPLYVAAAAALVAVVVAGRLLWMSASSRPHSTERR